ncbi:DNA translocase FtsK [Mucilaginibacter ginkgonis]|uniref:Uncharacterized protein n=1 Tax=Mucilaginibacter ginkgonis TaxID=2682091 RepID=A0A6I4HZ51_9SPHI|nr:DNA translocase FtsK [Mucilaginibacter ginkgonis]QQL50127.1 hypothetical protein GO620_001365 [Mucilaginibacter ginkgonis]
MYIIAIILFAIIVAVIIMSRNRSKTNNNSVEIEKKGKNNNPPNVTSKAGIPEPVLNSTLAQHLKQSTDDITLSEHKAPIYNASPEPKTSPFETLTASELVEKFGLYDPKLDLPDYKYPPIDLLDTDLNSSPVNAGDLDNNKQRIVALLNTHRIKIDAIKATVGPTVSIYEITPATGVRIQQIKNLETDIALTLSSVGTKVIGHIPGTNNIGIEVPHSTPQLVSIQSVLGSHTFVDASMQLPICLGKTMDNKVFVKDLATLPHLLIAGTTGQGKSVALTSIITSLLYKKHPAELKFVMIDLNGIELTPYSSIGNHFLAKTSSAKKAIVTSLDAAESSLSSLCIEMDRRYSLFQDAQTRTIVDYNKKFVNRTLDPSSGNRYLSYIVILIDEFADLQTTTNKSIEQLVIRLAQRGRSVGIHLIISTQRPSVKIITGVIKSNIASRLALKVITAIDSNTILDTSGAEHLNGNGEALFSDGINITHIQGGFVSSAEIEAVNSFINHQHSYATPMLLPEYIDSFAPKPFDSDDRDPMFEDAARLVVLHQQGSPSLIQRKLKLGYNRAGRIVDQLEAAGIVGPFEGSKAREVLYPDEYSLERYLEGLN